MDFARVEPHRIRRQGFPEAIYCPGKTMPQVIDIFGRLLKGPGPVLATRVTPELARSLLVRYPRAVHFPEARIVVDKPRSPSGRRVLVITAGTADGPVAEEAAVTAEALGRRVTRLYDVGVAGLHRLMIHQNLLKKAAVAIVCAGMEGPPELAL